MNQVTTEINDGLTEEERHQVMDYVYPLMHLLYADTTRCSQNALSRDPRFTELLLMMGKPQLLAEKLGFSDINKTKLIAINELYMAAIRTNYGKNSPVPVADHRAYYRQCILNEYHQETTVIVLLDDPVYRACSSQDRLNELEFLFAQMHFQSLPHQSREETKIQIKQEITRLYADPLTHHVIAALIYVMKSKSPYTRIIFSSSEAVSDDAIAYYEPRDSLIFCPRLSGIETSKMAKHRRSGLGQAFIHEALHFIFYTLYQNKAAPFKKGDKKKELQLQDALDDAATRIKNVIPKTLNEYQVSKIMDEVRAYDNTKDMDASINPSQGQSTPDIQHIESIVRPLECLAAGYALDVVNQIAPKVWSFYQDHCLPDIKAYVSAARQNMRADANFQPLKSDILFALPNDPSDHSAALNDTEQVEQLFIAMQSSNSLVYQQAAIDMNDLLTRLKPRIKESKISQLWRHWPQFPGVSSPLDKAFLRAMVYLFYTILQQPTVLSDQDKARQVICDHLITLLHAVSELTPQERLEQGEWLAEALRASADVLLNPDDVNVTPFSHEAYQRNLDDLNKLSTQLPGHASNHLFAVSVALMAIGCVVMVAFGLITTVPVLTASLIIVLHQIGLYHAAVVLGGGAGAVAGANLVGSTVGIASILTGLGLFAKNQPNGIAANVAELVQAAC